MSKEVTLPEPSGIRWWFYPLGLNDSKYDYYVDGDSLGIHPMPPSLLRDYEAHHHPLFQALLRP